MRDVDYTLDALAAFSRARGYDALVARCEAAINQWRGVAHEAHKRRDELAGWEAYAHIKHLERMKASLKPPGHHNREVSHERKE